MFKHIEEWEIIKARRNRREQRKTSKVDIDVDMNPMVDLAFLLLTFFMLTTTFNQPLIMDIVTPVKPDNEEVVQEQAVKESKTLTILMSGGDRIFWFIGITDPEIIETGYDKTGLPEILLEKNSEIEDMVVLIKADESADYQDLVNVLDEMQTAAIQRYAVVDITEDDRSLLKTVL